VKQADLNCWKSIFYKGVAITASFHGNVKHVEILLAFFLWVQQLIDSKAKM